MSASICVDVLGTTFWVDFPSATSDQLDEFERAWAWCRTTESADEDQRVIIAEVGDPHATIIDEQDTRSNRSVVVKASS